MKRTGFIRKRAPIRGGITAAQLDSLDELARECVMIRAGAALVEGTKRSYIGTCQKCWCVRPVCWCHIYTRAAKSVRWDLDNAFAWCSGCHRHLDQHWDEKQRWVINQIGQARFDALTLRSRPGRKIDQQAVYLYLTQSRARLLRGEAA